MVNFITFASVVIYECLIKNDGKLPIHTVKTKLHFAFKGKPVTSGSHYVSEGQNPEKLYIETF